MRKFFIYLQLAFYLLLIYLKTNDIHILEKLGVSTNTSSVLLNYLLVVLFINISQHFLYAYYRRKNGLSENQNDNIILGLNNISILTLIVVTIIALFALFNINVKTLVYSLSIVAAALAVITKDYISNLISGLIITFSNQFSIGDNVKINDNKGKIVDITLSTIHLLNDDDDLIYIPNSVVFNSLMINYTKRDIKKISIEFEIDIKFLKSIETLQDELMHAIDDYKTYVKEDSFYLKIVEIKKDYLILKFQYILKDTNRLLEKQIRRQTTRTVADYISESNYLKKANQLKRNIENMPKKGETE
jgi:small-conductance mechanosensitive channel